MRLFYLILSWFVITEGIYEANWDSLDSRPLPQWYDKAKVGILIHWGVYSVPSVGSEWFWRRWMVVSSPYINYIKNNYPALFAYEEFAKEFRAELFNADRWAELFAKSGAKYVVLTSKHYDGFTLWPSSYSDHWNSINMGPRRDIVAELYRALRRRKLIYGLYYSLYEFYHFMYTLDSISNFTKQEFVLKKVFPEIQELVEGYKPSILWSDTDNSAPDTYWKSKEFLAWLYNESPVKDIVVTNDRWGKDTTCEHGGFFTCKDKYNPGVLREHKWEKAISIDKESFGFRRNAHLSSYYNISELLHELVVTVSCGGNILINVGPTKEGIIPPIFEERLLQLGEWLGINGEAIYETTPWQSQCDTLDKDVWYTSKGSIVYAIVLKWHDNLILADSVELFNNSATTVVMVGNEQDGPLQFTITNVDDLTGVNKAAVSITLPNKSKVLSQWAYVLKMYSNI